LVAVAEPDLTRVATTRQGARRPLCGDLVFALIASNPACAQQELPL